MALQTLLESPAVLDLCGAEVVLPSEPVQLKDAAPSRPFATAASPLTTSGKLTRALSTGGGAFGGAGSANGYARDHERPQKLLKLLGGEQPIVAAASENGRARMSSTFLPLVESLALCIGLLARWARDAPNLAPLESVQRTLQGCMTFARQLATLATQQKAAGVHRQLGAFLSSITTLVRAMEPGGIVLLPAGWLYSFGTEGDIVSEDAGHCILLLLVRATAGVVNSGGEFSLCLLNTGEGVNYHPVKPWGSAPTPERPVRQLAVVLSGISARRITSSAFWYMLYRQVTHPSPSNGAKFVYGTLLPSLNRRPLNTNFGVEPAGWAEFRLHPASGDSSFVHCVQAAVQLCLQHEGLGLPQAAWCAVRFRRGVLAALLEALAGAGGSELLVEEVALARMASVSMARACSDYDDVYCRAAPQMREKLASEFEQMRRLSDQVAAKVDDLENAERNSTSVQPPCCSPDEVAAPPAKDWTKFGAMERLLSQDVEALKGDVSPPRVALSVPTCLLPGVVRTAGEAADCCRLATGLLTVLANQQEHVPQSAPARFALISHLVTEVLPMPMPLDHAERSKRCFWAAQVMSHETKMDIMRQLHLISRHFAAVCYTLLETRGTDGGRVVVAAALAAVMDALMRRPLTGTFNGSLVSLHYSGQSGGPGQPFGVDPGAFMKASDTLLFVAPEYQALRALLLGYFESVGKSVKPDHLIFQFDESMGCSEGDHNFIEQLGICLGLETGKTDVPLLVSGENPELTEPFPELVWFRDVVFLWKVLLLPVGSGPEKCNWRASDAVLQWRWDTSAEHFVVRGFDTKLSPDAGKASVGFLRGVVRWLGGYYRSDDKAVSGASPSVLTGVEGVQTEEDVLFLHHVPSFNGALNSADSELLLTYLTAPYLRIPLVLGFFVDRARLVLLREPQLQAILDSVLFEPGPWQSRADEEQGAPQSVPARDRSHLGTPVGLLFNELVRSPRVVVEAMLSMLRAAVDKDVGRPDTGNEGLILFLIRLVVRVESYMAFLLQQAHSGPASWGHFSQLRGLEGLESVSIITELEAAHAKIRQEMMGEVSPMLLSWISWSMKQSPKALTSACRAHAHLALLHTNVPDDQLGAREITTFLSSQIFVNMNHQWFRPGSPLLMLRQFRWRPRFPFPF